MKEFKYKINGSPYRVVVNKSDNEIVELEVNGTPFTVEIEPKTKKPKTIVQRHQTTDADPILSKKTTSTLVTKPSSTVTWCNIGYPLQSR